MPQANQPINQNKSDEQGRIIDQGKFFPETQLLIPQLSQGKLFRDHVCIIVHPEGVHASVYEDHHEGKEEVKQQPDVNHLDVGGLGEIVVRTSMEVKLTVITD